MAISETKYFEKWPFRIVPEHNPEIWADRSQLFSEIQGIFNIKDKMFPSKIYTVWGAFGAGKSHLLRHFKWLLEKEKNGFVIFSPFPKQTIKGFFQLYQVAFAERMNFYLLGQSFAEIWKAKGDTGELEYLFEIANLVDNWYDFAQVVLTLGKLFCNSPRLNDPHFMLARKWLCGYRLLKDEREILQVNDNIRTDDDAIRLFSAITRVLTVSGTRFVVWMLDDCHVLLSRSLERKRDLILHGLKTAFDESPNNVILVLSIATKDPEAVEEFLIPDLVRRIKKIEVPALSEKEAFIFITDLLKTYQKRENPTYYPFSEKKCINDIIYEVSKSDLSPGSLMIDFDSLLREAERSIYPDLVTTDFIKKFYKSDES